MPVVTKSLGEGTQSVLLTASILECLARNPDFISITDLAAEIGTSKSRVFRHLQTLVRCEYAFWNKEKGQYGVGPRLLSLSRTINERYDIPTLATSVMMDLRNRFGHSVIVSRLESDGLQVLKSVTGNSSIVIDVRPGTLLPFDRSAQGRVAIAFASPSQRSLYSNLQRAHSKFSVSHAEELAAIVRQGWAAAQMREGLNGIAAPVFDQSGDLIATLAILNTMVEIGKEAKPATVAALVRSAQMLSRRMGMIAPPE